MFFVLFMAIRKPFETSKHNKNVTANETRKKNETEICKVAT